MENETREYIRDYLNGTYTEEELALKFDLIKCSECLNYELEEDLINHKWDLAQEEEAICEDCRNNE
jgi:hypothetical protein